MLITLVNSQCFEMRPAVKTGKGKKNLFQTVMATLLDIIKCEFFE